MIAALLALIGFHAWECTADNPAECPCPHGEAARG